MPSYDPDQKKPVDEQAALTITQKVEAYHVLLRNGRSNFLRGRLSIWLLTSGALE